MDPNEAWKRMCEALLERDLEEAQEYAEALQGWLRSGGFAPRGVNGQIALDVARVVNGCIPCEWVDQTGGVR